MWRLNLRLCYFVIFLYFVVRSGFVSALAESENNSTYHGQRRDRSHINSTLQLDVNSTTHINAGYDVRLILEDLNRVHKSMIAPVEKLYQFDSLGLSTISTAEIYAKPMVLVIGPWSTGKSSIINYVLDIEDSPHALYAGAEPTTSDFTILVHGDDYQTLDGIVLAADKKREFSELEKFGQTFLERLQGRLMPSLLLKHVTIVDTPGIIENRRQQERGYPFNEVMKWFIKRAALILTTFDPSKLDVGLELESTFKQLKGRESQIRIILNKADSLEFTSLMRVYGALFWNLSPLINVTEPPRVYIGSFWSLPFKGPAAYHELFLKEEVFLLQDLFDVSANSVQNKIAMVRQHSIQVLIHAEMVSAYVGAFQKEDSYFADHAAVWSDVVSNPERYDISRYVLASTPVINKYDLPPMERYLEFFRVARLDSFSPLSSHCSYLFGCVRDKLVEAITIVLPQMLTKYRSATCSSAGRQAGYCELT